MPSERDAEILSKIDLLIELARRQDARLNKLESEVADSKKDFATFKEKDFGALKEYIAEFRGEVRGRLDEMSNRISDVNSRLPVPIAYAPPTKPAA